MIPQTKVGFAQRDQKVLSVSHPLASQRPVTVSTRPVAMPAWPVVILEYKEVSVFGRMEKTSFVIHCKLVLMLIYI
jgi:hypothetical protein